MYFLVTMVGRWSDIPVDKTRTFINRSGWLLQMWSRHVLDNNRVIFITSCDIFQAKRREDLEAEDLEILWLEVCPYKSSHSLFIGAVYRPPSFGRWQEAREKHWERTSSQQGDHFIGRYQHRFPMHHEISKTSIHKNAAKSESNYLHKQVFHHLTSPFCPFDEADIHQCYSKNPALFGCKRSQIELEYLVYHVHCQVELRVTGSLQACYLVAIC